MPGASTAAATAAGAAPLGPLDALAEADAAGYVVDQWSDRAYAASDLRFLPDGRALLATTGGQVELLDAAGRHVRTLLALPVCAGAAGGIAALELAPGGDPADVYLRYAPAQPACSDGAGTGRLARFALATDRIDPASERVLVDGLPTGADGGLASLPDGALLVPVAGAVLRVPPDARGLRAAQAAVHATGLGAPGRVAVEATTGEVMVVDVGATWTELDVVEPGGAYGAPATEGPDAGDGSLPPAFAYRHGEGCTGGIGGAWLAPPFVADAARSAYVFSDRGCPGVWALEPGAGLHLVRIAPDLPYRLGAVVAGPDGAAYLLPAGPDGGPILRLAPNG